VRPHEHATVNENPFHGSGYEAVMQNNCSINGPNLAQTLTVQITPVLYMLGIDGVNVTSDKGRHR